MNMRQTRIVAAMLAVCGAASAQTLLVTSTGNGKVLQYRLSDGAFIDEFIVSGVDLAPPFGIRYGPNGNIFITGYDADKVVEYDGQSGLKVRDFITRQGSQTYPDNPQAIAFVPTGLLGPGRVLVANGMWAGSQVSVYNSSGTSISTGPVGGPQGFPSFMSFKPNGQVGIVFVTWNFSPTRNGRVTAHSLSDFSALRVYEGTIGGIVGGNAVRPNGNLLVADQLQNRVVEFETTGTGLFGTQINVFARTGNGYSFARPRDMIWGPNGNLLVACGDSNNVVEFDGSTGAYVRTVVQAGAGGVSGPWSLAIGPACRADMDRSGGLGSNDFQAFLNAYAAGDPRANCDRSTGTPALGPNDFQCFLDRFAAGCS